MPERPQLTRKSKIMMKRAITTTLCITGIDGKQFDSSRGDVPLACRLRDLIEGWIIAMQQMHIGDRWEVYIPAEMGHGKYWLRLPLSRLGKAQTSSAFLSLLHRFPTRHPWRLHTHLRHQTARHQSINGLSLDHIKRDASNKDTPLLYLF